MATTKQETFTTAVEFNECAACKQCCKDIDEGICGYNTLAELLTGRIPTSMVERFVIFRIETKYLDILASDWCLFPSVNILPLITLPVNGIYEYLALPVIHDGCPFITDHGCRYNDIKLFDCRVFPFYFEKGEFHTFNNCAYTKKLNLEEMKRSLQQTTAEFIAFSKANQKLYFQELPKLKAKYHIKVYDITPNTNPEVCAAVRLLQ